MALNDGSITFTVEADTKDFEKGFQIVEKGAEAMERAAADLGEKAEKAGQAVDALGENAEKSGSGMENAAGALQETVDGASEAADGLHSASDAMTDLSGGAETAAESLEGTAQASASLAESADDVVAAMDSAGATALNAASGMEDYSASLGDAASSGADLSDSGIGAVSSMNDQVSATDELIAMFNQLLETIRQEVKALQEMTDVLRNAETQTKQNSEATQELTKSTNKIARLTAFSTYGKMAITALKSVVNTCKELIDVYAVQEQAEIRLEAVNRSMGESVGLTAAELKEMASALQTKSTFGDEIVMGAEKSLLALGTLNKEGFERALQASADLAAAMGTDINSAAQTMAMALQDPENGLRRLRQAHIMFTDAEKEQIKTLTEAGDIQKAQLLILSKVESSYKGMAEAIAGTDTGKLKQISNTWGDIKEKLGEGILDTVSPFLDAVLKKLGQIDDFANRRRETKKNSESFEVSRNGADLSVEQLKDMRAEYTRRMSAEMASAEGNKYLIKQITEYYDEIIKDLDRVISQKEREAQAEANIASIRANSNWDAEEEALQEELRLEEEIASARKDSESRVASFIDEHGIKSEEEAIRAVREEAARLKGEMVELGMAYDIFGEPVEQFKALDAVISDCDERLEALANKAIADVVSEFGSLSETFKADATTAEIEKIDKALEALADRTDETAERLRKGLEEARDALSGKISAKDLIAKYGSRSASFQREQTESQIGELRTRLLDPEITEEDAAKIREIIDSLEADLERLGHVAGEVAEEAGKEMFNEFSRAFQQISSALSGMFSAFTDMQNQFLQNDIDNLEAELDAHMEAGDITQEEEKKRQEEISNLKARQFEAEKKNNVAQALMSGAQAVMSAWAANGGVPWLAAAISAMITATTAMQVATINAQQFTGFERGGIVGGSGITGDNHLILANAGELILTRAQQANIAGQLQQQSTPVISVNFSGNVFGSEEAISEYVYNGIKTAQREGALGSW